MVIGDGAEWIWNLADHHYLGATQIVDLWHACEHIHALAHTLLRRGEPTGQALGAGPLPGPADAGPTEAVAGAAADEGGTPEQAEAVRRERGYFTRNRHRMQYPQVPAGGDDDRQRSGGGGVQGGSGPAVEGVGDALE